MDPIRELPYGPAACERPLIEAGHMSAPDYAPAIQKILLAPKGASTHVQNLSHIFSCDGLRFRVSRPDRVPACSCTASLTIRSRDVPEPGCREIQTGLAIRERTDHAGPASDLPHDPLQRIGNRYEDGGAYCPCCDVDRGVWCDHPGQRRREHEGAGRPTRTMSCELALVAGRLCDSPGCAVSADP